MMCGAMGFLSNAHRKDVAEDCACERGHAIGEEQQRDTHPTALGHGIRQAEDANPDHAADDVERPEPRRPFDLLVRLRVSPEKRDNNAHPPSPGPSPPHLQTPKSWP